MNKICDVISTVCGMIFEEGLSDIPIEEISVSVRPPEEKVVHIKIDIKLK